MLSFMGSLCWGLITFVALLDIVICLGSSSLSFFSFFWGGGGGGGGQIVIVVV
jgi:hypothetical protein